MLSDLMTEGNYLDLKEKLMIPSGLPEPHIPVAVLPIG